MLIDWYRFVEIMVLPESPNNQYERIDVSSPISKSVANSVSTFKPLTSSLSTSAVNPQPVSLLSSNGSFSRPGGGSLSLRDQFAKRPLPPVPKKSEITAPRKSLPTDRLFTRHGNSERGSSNRRYNHSKSQPIPRSGSEPDLLGEETRRQRLSSSQSLEFLNIEVPQKEDDSSRSSKSFLMDAFRSLPRPNRRRMSPASAVAVSNREPRPRSGTETVTSWDGETVAVPPRPPRPAQQSAEEIVNNFCALKRNSVLQRRRPVDRGMRTAAPRSNHVEPTSDITQLPEDTDITVTVRSVISPP